MRTGDNFRYLRYWWEIGSTEISLNCSNKHSALLSKKKWFPYMKGGGKSRWYGNQEYIVNWEDDGIDIKENTRHNYPQLGDNLGWKITNEGYYFREGITWSCITAKGTSFRISPPGYIFDVQGSTAFIDKGNIFALLAVLNSKIIDRILSLLNPTIAIQTGDIARIPICAPTTDQLEIFNKIVPICINIQQNTAKFSETTFDFVAPLAWKSGGPRIEKSLLHLSNIETQVNEHVFEMYKITSDDRAAIEIDLSSGKQIEEVENQIEKPDGDEPLDFAIANDHKVFSWLSYAAGIIFSRFQPGTRGALGSAIYHRKDFAVGSLPEPSEEEFDELVGEPSQFAYIDEQGGRHVFSHQLEDGLRKLALPDGIAVFDLNHPRDLPTLVSKALELMLGQAQAQEVIQQAAGGDLRKYLEKDFFTQHHIKQYRKRPVYWPIQSSKRSYGFVLFHEKIDRNTFYALQQEPYLPTKRRAVQLRLEELGKKVLTVQGAARKPIEKEMDELRQLAEELAQFAKDLDAITRGGYEPEADWIDDGVILRMAPLWSVIPLWKSEPKKYWDELAAGKYDWSRIAMKYWPERVKQACKKNKSYAIAHGHEEWYAGK